MLTNMFVFLKMLPLALKPAQEFELILSNFGVIPYCYFTGWIKLFLTNILVFANMLPLVF